MCLTKEDYRLCTRQPIVPLPTNQIHFSGLSAPPPPPSPPLLIGWWNFFSFSVIFVRARESEKSFLNSSLQVHFTRFFASSFIHQKNPLRPFIFQYKFEFADKLEFESHFRVLSKYEEGNFLSSQNKIINYSQCILGPTVYIPSVLNQCPFISYEEIVSFQT